MTTIGMRQRIKTIVVLIGVLVALALVFMAYKTQGHPVLQGRLAAPGHAAVMLAITT